MSTQALSGPISSLSLLLVQTQAARWKAVGPEQLTGAHLEIDITKVRLTLSWVFQWYQVGSKLLRLIRYYYRPQSVKILGLYGIKSDKIEWFKYICSSVNRLCFILPFCGYPIWCSWSMTSFTQKSIFTIAIINVIAMCVVDVLFKSNGWYFIYLGVIFYNKVCCRNVNIYERLLDNFLQ